MEKGDEVKEGDVLVRLDARDYEARVAESRARLAQSRARLAELTAGYRAEDIARQRATVAELEARLVQAERDFIRAGVLVNERKVEATTLLENAETSRDTTRAQLAAAKADLDRLVAGPRVEEIDGARADVAAAEAALEFSSLQVEDTVIRAPITGTILEKLVEVGELVTPQSFGGTRGARTELLSIANLAELQVEVDINESDFQKITMGMPARVYLDAYPDTAYTAHVREIAPEANREKATIQVKVALDAPDRLVRPEMSARVEFLPGK